MVPASTAKPSATLWEPFLVYFVSALGVLGTLFLMQGGLAEYRAGFIGFLYLFLPILVCRRNNLPQAEYAPLEAPNSFLKTLLLPLALTLFFFPFFFFLGPKFLLSPSFGQLALPKNFLLIVLTQFLVIALPEEFFFRGYLQRRFDDFFSKRITFLSVSVGFSLILSSALFAFAHFLTLPHPLRLLTFFPGLVFGFLRAATKGIWAAVLFHGLCNLFLEILIASSSP